MLERYESLEDLAWRFQQADASIGVRAQNMGDVKGCGVFDDAASHRLHTSMREGKHRHNVQEMRRIDACLGQMSHASQEALRLAFSPSGRVSSAVASHFEITVKAFEKVSLLGYALQSRAMRIAYASHHETVVAPDQDQVLAWLESEAKPEALKRVKRDVMAELEPLVAEYDGHRLAWVERMREEKRILDAAKAEHLQEQIDATRRKLWGVPT
jgi:hypothetical protein